MRYRARPTKSRLRWAWRGWRRRIPRSLRGYAPWFRRAARRFSARGFHRRPRVRVLRISLWMGLLTRLWLFWLQPTLLLAELVLLFGSCWLLPLCGAVQYRLASGSG